MKLQIITLAIMFLCITTYAQNNTSYQYDNLNRLTKVVYANGYEIAYTYDELGNRLTKEVKAAAGFVVTAQANPVSGGVVTGSGTYQSGQSCTLTATANSGYTFTNWTENDTLFSINDTISFTVSNNRAFIANFTALNINDGLVAYYPFNGNANDESGNGLHGTVIGDVAHTTDRYGNPNSAYLFPGNPFNYIRVEHNELLSFNEFTLSAWIYTETDYGYGQIIQKERDINNGHYGLYTAGVAGTVLYGGINGAFTTEPQIGIWQMVTGTIKNDTAKFYINGRLVADTILSNSYHHVGNDPLTIGMHYYSGVPDYYTYPYKGKIDDIRIYNRTLNESEVASLYISNFQPPTVTTSEIASITQTTATSGGSITSDGGAPVTARGVCWNTTGNPTLADSTTTDGTGTGSFTSTLSGLNPGTSYYIRSYATNSEGTAYGEELTFTTDPIEWPRDTITAVVDVFNPATGRTWMDRNLGASRAAISINDEGAYGDLYQWGRGTDGHEKRNSDTTSILAASDMPGHSNFITKPDNPYDWHIPQNNNLWQGENGTNNPCPCGYRLPTEAEWEAERLSWSSNNAVGAFSSPLKLPVGGHRGYNSGLIYYVNTDGYYWSSNVDSIRSRALLPFGGNTGMGNSNRAYGFSVRCIKDESPQASLPTVTTTEITSITHNTATSGGNITSDGGAPVTARGVCWNTTGNPTFADNHTNDSTGTGAWVSELAELQPATLYYVRAFAANSVGTAYGHELTFTTDPTEWPRDTITAVVDVFNPVTGRIWMDRNLGAGRAATSSTDVLAYGDLYQWGRGADGHQNRNSFTTTTLSLSDSPGHDNFILATSYPYDWHSPQSDSLWQGVNGINNPCPCGYRVPTEAEWEAERLSWSINNQDGAFASPLKLPVAGNRSYFTGSFLYMSSAGYYWSSSADGLNSKNLVFFGNVADMEGIYRAYGNSIRCIKDESTQASLPSVRTTEITNITKTTATSGGDITSDGGAPVTARGVCWNTTGNPSVDDNKTSEGEGIGEFNSSLTGLTANAIYYIRAYATNSVGVSYGNQVQFTTQGEILSGNFVTRWDLPDDQETIQFNLVRSGDVNYTWETVPAGQTGSGTLIGGDGLVEINGLPAGATIRLRLAPDSLKHFYSGPDHINLIDVEQWGNAEWNSMTSAFSGCNRLNISATDIPDLTNVSDLSYMFSLCNSLNGPDNIAEWDVSNIKSMTALFFWAELFNEDISNWNVSNTEQMNGMFSYAKSFNQSIGSWNVSKVTNMGGMFQYATSFNQPIGNWNVSNVTNMYYTFVGASKFNQPIQNWNVGKVEDMTGMFSSASAFNQPINDWEVSSVKYMSYLFGYTTSFNQPLNNWDVSKVIDMGWMFYNATSFNQAMGSWNLISVNNMENMLNGCAIDCQNYSETLTGWNNNPNTPSNITLDANGLEYNLSGSVSRGNLISDKGWIINGDSQNDYCSNIPDNLNTGTIILSSGESTCFNAFQTITVAGGGTAVNFESGSTVDLIAGQSIHFLPGFHAHSGSQMNARITTDGTFCDGASPVIVYQPETKSSESNEGIKPGKPDGMEKVVKVYPNPNTGRFTVALTNFENYAGISLYNALGSKIFESWTNLPSYEMDLPGIQKGVYFIKVTNGKEQVTKKMVVN